MYMNIGIYSIQITVTRMYSVVARSEHFNSRKLIVQRRTPVVRVVTPPGISYPCYYTYEMINILIILGLLCKVNISLSIYLYIER